MIAPARGSAAPERAAFAMSSETGGTGALLLYIGLQARFDEARLPGEQA